jgi:SAM-dependent methyltransferase
MVLPTHRLYTDLAWLWPAFSPPADYADDAGQWRDALRQRLGPGRHSLLELGSGGGHTLSHLTDDFNVTAVDLSPQMLALSQELNPEVPHHRGDMRDIRLGKQFDAVAIHDAVCYLLTEQDLLATFATARQHLHPGGILLLTPDYLKESFSGPRVLHWICFDASPPFTVIEYCYDLDGTDTTMESLFLFLIHEPTGLRVVEDRHITGLFPSTTWLQLLDEAGFDAELHTLPGYEGGYGGHLFVATLR